MPYSAETTTEETLDSEIASTTTPKRYQMPSEEALESAGNVQQPPKPQKRKVRRAKAKAKPKAKAKAAAKRMPPIKTKMNQQKSKGKSQNQDEKQQQNERATRAGPQLHFFATSSCQREMACADKGQKKRQSAHAGHAEQVPE